MDTINIKVRNYVSHKDTIILVDRGVQVLYPKQSDYHIEVWLFLLILLIAIFKKRAATQPTPIINNIPSSVIAEPLTEYNHPNLKGVTNISEVGMEKVNKDFMSSVVVGESNIKHESM
jgi:hypothetical protein